MASTSSSVGNACEPLLRCGKYDVFINHCVIDEENSLASTIYHTLGMIGVRAFRGSEELEAGEEISHAIIEAICGAFIHIAIFSPNYAKYPSCLDDLALMLQTGKKIIPIFYHVKPSHLRWVAGGSGVYSEAFSTYEKDGYPPQQLKDWKNALATVSQISGLELNESENDEGLLLRKIVNNVKEEMTDCGKYKVFINHRGIDVKNSLASTIYHTLGVIGVKAFLDREELETGKEISDAIKEAISDAVVHIAIFSPNYVQSRWCLDELMLMLETGKKIIPIFYNVKPSDLRCVANGREVYSQALSRHEELGRYPPETLERWTKALSRFAEIKGYEVDEHQRDEGLLLKKIVNDVRKETEKLALLHVAEHPVGLDEAIKEFQNLVEESRHDVKIVGIVGLGGLGKTTLVKEYFNRKRSSYARSSFLFDVRDAAAKNRLHDLQKKLVEDLLHIRGLAIRHTYEGKRTLEHRVGSLTVLIVLDDVDHIDQIKALLPFLGNFLPHSLIIITTRDLGVITSSASLSPSASVIVYTQRALAPVHAKQLFCWHAFSRDFVVKGYEELVEQFLTACEGLPLTLKVLGAQLCRNNSRDYWKSVLHKISKISPEDIMQRLKVSFDALDEELQQKFRDVACLFIGEEKDMVISKWDESGWDRSFWSGLQSFQILEDKCLVELDNENRIRMHHHLRDLVREHF